MSSDNANNPPPAVQAAQSQNFEYTYGTNQYDVASFAYNDQLTSQIEVLTNFNSYLSALSGGTSTAGSIFSSLGSSFTTGSNLTNLALAEVSGLQGLGAILSQNSSSLTGDQQQDLQQYMQQLSALEEQLSGTGSDANFSSDLSGLDEMLEDFSTYANSLPPSQLTAYESQYSTMLGNLSFSAQQAANAVGQLTAEQQSVAEIDTAEANVNNFFTNIPYPTVSDLSQVLQSLTLLQNNKQYLSSSDQSTLQNYLTTVDNYPVQINGTSTTMGVVLQIYNFVNAASSSSSSFTFPASQSQLLGYVASVCGTNSSLYTALADPNIALTGSLGSPLFSLFTTNNGQTPPSYTNVTSAQFLSNATTNCICPDPSVTPTPTAPNLTLALTPGDSNVIDLTQQAHALQSVATSLNNMAAAGSTQYTYEGQTYDTTDTSGDITAYEIGSITDLNYYINQYMSGSTDLGGYTSSALLNNLGNEVTGLQSMAKFLATNLPQTTLAEQQQMNQINAYIAQLTKISSGLTSSPPDLSNVNVSNLDQIYVDLYTYANNLPPVPYMTFQENESSFVSSFSAALIDNKIAGDYMNAFFSTTPQPTMDQTFFEMYNQLSQNSATTSTSDTATISAYLSSLNNLMVTTPGGTTQTLGDFIADNQSAIDGGDFSFASKAQISAPTGGSFPQINLTPPSTAQSDATSISQLAYDLSTVSTAIQLGQVGNSSLGQQAVDLLMNYMQGQNQVLSQYTNQLNANNAVGQMYTKLMNDVAGFQDAATNYTFFSQMLSNPTTITFTLQSAVWFEEAGQDPRTHTYGSISVNTYPGTAAAAQAALNSEESSITQNLASIQQFVSDAQNYIQELQPGGSVAEKYNLTPSDTQPTISALQTMIQTLTGTGDVSNPSPTSAMGQLQAVRQSLAGIYIYPAPSTSPAISSPGSLSMNGNTTLITLAQTGKVWAHVSGYGHTLLNISNQVTWTPASNSFMISTNPQNPFPTNPVTYGGGNFNASSFTNLPIDPVEQGLIQQGSNQENNISTGKTALSSVSSELTTNSAQVTSQTQTAQMQLQMTMTQIQQEWTIVSTLLQALNDAITGTAKEIYGG